MALKDLIVLPSGVAISSGVKVVPNIRSCSFKEASNDGEELKLGSTMASMLSLTIQTSEDGLDLDVEDEITYYKVNDSGTRTKIGPFVVTDINQSSTYTYKITAYDQMTKLDVDMTEWLAGLAEWPYTLRDFAQMVCYQCGVTLATQNLPNGDFPVNRFYASQATGREIMGWIGELAGRFVRATSDGKIELAWYTSSGVSLTPGGSRYMMGLKHAGYQVQKIDAVQIRLADSENGALWPQVHESANSYIISGNRLITEVTEDTEPYLQNILAEVGSLTYTPCNLSIPACLDVRAGQTIRFTDKKGNTYTAAVMSKTQKGQRDTIESTGSYRRDSPGAVNNQAKDPSSAADDALKKLTRQEIFDKLTNNGQNQGLYIDPDTGELYINASYIKSGEFVADLITAGVLKSADGETFYLDLDNGTFSMRGSGRFMSVSGDAYITVEGDEIVLYARAGDTEDFLPKIRLGFNSDENGTDYPYVLLGNTEGGRMGLIKKFSDGLWVGNSVPQYDTGEFDPSGGAVGFFIDTEGGTPYTVSDGTMRDITVAVFG